MYTKQRTIKRPISIEGIGLHTGNGSILTFRPAPPDSGVKFIRTDLPGKPSVMADIDHVIDISRGTTLGNGEAKVYTVEHVLAAIAGLQIDNLDIEVNANEPPVVDGSSRPFADKLLEAEIETQDADRYYLEIDTTLSYSEPDRHVDIVVTPSDRFRITFMIDYRNPALGTQYTTLIDLESEFVEEFAPARTFCFLSEVEMLKNQGLIKGGGLNNAVVIYDSDLGQVEVDRIRNALNLKDEAFVGKTGIINDIPLRFYNEPVRHKALDLIGDLFLIGVPIKGHILAARSGHKANVELVKKIRALYEKKKLLSKYQKSNQEPFLDIDGIMKIMPHRYPFLLIDKVIELEPEKRVVAIKNVTINEPFFQGHFPGRPIMPGVLIIEAMAQAGGILLLKAVPEPEKKLVYFLSIDGVKFRRPVKPGDTIRFELDMKAFRRNTCKMTGKGFVDDTLVVEAELMAMVMDR
ncbi:Bifunctional enzyme LpxC/FabZ (Includes: UDP-3-O-(3-hydroxymyristoyl) N-acetylglucosamine deacetylase; 3-hydroxyacyl-(acyl-carrier-protein) dehydratase FabZ) [Candidatus Zixiibacteriota bacterium]|nr:Bifunctional enzyme LpxC/FabZ (Includes: UDP-3-O-(3-hydroxymyristoyl) N-acetylglucosamine deacetylase; 3-hydroxyacyl-(acyl-carrier-protein) dehydratase FabZ) [candidate division Zixibacteria bacterium]